MGKAQHAALAEEEVVVELLRESFPQLERVLVDRGALVPQVVGANDGRVAGHVAACQPASLEHRDVRDAVILRKVVGGRQPMAARTDNDDVIGALGLRTTPEMIWVRVWFVHPSS